MNWLILIAGPAFIAVSEIGSAKEVWRLFLGARFFGAPVDHHPLCAFILGVLLLSAVFHARDHLCLRGSSPLPP
jgi:hypothetical protein